MPNCSCTWHCYRPLPHCAHVPQLLAARCAAPICGSCRGPRLLLGTPPCRADLALSRLVAAAPGAGLATQVVTALALQVRHCLQAGLGPGCQGSRPGAGALGLGASRPGAVRDARRDGRAVPGLQPTASTPRHCGALGVAVVVEIVVVVVAVAVVAVIAE
jgi:hypothetical protein